jgi:hypothetical protein
MCVLFSDAVSTRDYMRRISGRWRIMKWKQCGRKWMSWYLFGGTEKETGILSQVSRRRG